MAKNLNKRRNRNRQNSTSAAEQREKQYASWWQENLSRRDMNKKILGGAAIGAAFLFIVLNGNDDEYYEYEEYYDESVERDALELQRQSGWNVGSTAGLTLSYPVLTDSRGGSDWMQLLQPTALLGAYKPARESLQPYVVPTLVQSLGEGTLREVMKPVYSPAMLQAYARGLGMRDILKKSSNPDSTMIVVDLPGPQSVAFAAALSDVAEPLVNFDNWPHPSGSVKSHETLAAMLYYAAEVQANRSKRTQKAPPLIVLDRDRIAPPDAADVAAFDNRYVAKMPTAQNLKSMGISHVLYVTPHSGTSQESDDLNEDFAVYNDEKIDVALLPLGDFTNGSTTTAASTNPTVSTQSASAGAGGAYYYGGHSHGHAFFYYYGMYTPARPFPASYTPPAHVRRPAYTATRRPTVFSSRSVGGMATGIGRQRPTGFGRVSTAVDNTGRTRVGRTGSFGRAGGRGFSS